MEISKLVEAKGYKNSTVKICEFLGFSDTDQLKRAKFFAIQETYSPIPVLGISINNGDPTWRLCEVNNDVDELYSVDEGYKICHFLSIQAPSSQRQENLLKPQKRKMTLTYKLRSAANMEFSQKI